MVFDDLVDVAGGNVEERNDGDVSVGFIDDGLNSFHVLGKAPKMTPIEVLREIKFDDSIVLLGVRVWTSEERRSYEKLFVKRIETSIKTKEVRIKG